MLSALLNITGLVSPSTGRTFKPTLTAEQKQSPAGCGQSGTNICRPSMASRCQLSNILCHLFCAEHQVSASGISKSLRNNHSYLCYDTVCLLCMCRTVTNACVCVCAYREGRDEENVHVTTVCGAAVTVRDIQLKLFSVKERVEGKRKQLS